MSVTCHNCGSDALKIQFQALPQAYNPPENPGSLKRKHTAQLTQPSKQARLVPAQEVRAPQKTRDRKATFARSPSKDVRISNFLKYTLFGDVDRIPEVGVLYAGNGNPPQDLDLAKFYAILVHRSDWETAEQLMKEIDQRAEAHEALTSRLQDKIYCTLNVYHRIGITEYKKWFEAAEADQKKDLATIQAKQAAGTAPVTAQPAQPHEHLQQGEVALDASSIQQTAINPSSSSQPQIQSNASDQQLRIVITPPEAQADVSPVLQHVPKPKQIGKKPPATKRTFTPLVTPLASVTVSGPAAANSVAASQNDSKEEEKKEAVLNAPKGARRADQTQEGGGANWEDV